MCRNCGNSDDKHDGDIWGAVFAARDSKAAAEKPAAPAPKSTPASRDQNNA